MPKRYFICALLLFEICLEASPKTRTLYNSLDPTSISQHLAFYKLYPQEPEGKRALKQVWALLTGQNSVSMEKHFDDSSLSFAFNALIDLVNKPNNPLTALEEDKIALIEKIGSRLSNRKLKGYRALKEAEVLALESHEIDLARGLLLSQLGERELQKIRSYEVALDLMALQILARLPEQASPKEKIRVINDYIFCEMGFRFPPHSEYAKEIDIYTFLPSVLDGRRGVCLGVSILYICLAQRLDLPLEMITPPGHIFVRYAHHGEEINIETTARGIHLPSEEYLTFSTKSLQKRNIKEVIGLTYFNQASRYLSEGTYQQALDCYHKAALFLPEDPQLLELMAYQYILIGDRERGIELLKKSLTIKPEHIVYKDTLPEDVIENKVNEEGLKAFFMHVDENRASILTKKDALENILRQCPEFRAGIFSLAVAWFQLHRKGEALSTLEKYHELNPHDPTAEYYLTELYADRMDYNKAWFHFHNVEEILNKKEYSPKILKELRRTLKSLILG